MKITVDLIWAIPFFINLLSFYAVFYFTGHNKIVSRIGFMEIDKLILYIILYAGAGTVSFIAWFITIMVAALHYQGLQGI